MEQTKVKALKTQQDQVFKEELKTLVNNFRTGHIIKDFVADLILEDYPIGKATSVTWLVYEVCNAFNDSEIGRYNYLSEIVADIEDLVDNIKELVKIYK